MRGMSATSVCGPYSSRHRASTRRIARVSKRLLTPVRGTTPTAGSEPRCLTVSGAGEGRLTNSCSSFETQPRPYGKGNYNLTKGRPAQWGAGGAQAIADPSDRERARQDVVRADIGLLQHRQEHPPVDCETSVASVSHPRATLATHARHSRLPRKAWPVPHSDAECSE